MTRIAITGASGLVGANLAWQAATQGFEVRGLRRATSRTGHLAGVALEWCLGDVCDCDSLIRAFAGAEIVFHCAAALDDGSADPTTIRRVNVLGTRKVIAAARAARVKRLVHCSTTNTIGIAPPGEAADETTPWNWNRYRIATPYTTSKLEAEELVLAACRTGLDAVIVNPSLVLGPYDTRPGSGKLLLELIRLRLPFYTPGVKNLVDARDVAQGMLAAAERGRTGERYILGGEDISIRDLMFELARLTDMPKPWFRLPGSMVQAYGFLTETWARFSGRPAAIDRMTARFGCLEHRVSSAKAAQELGYTSRPLTETIRDTLAWFVRAGLLRDHLTVASEV